MKILVAGDFCPRQRVADRLKLGDFESVLGEVKPIIKEADYSIVNFECPICKGRESPIDKCGPNLSCSEYGIKAAQWVGFKCLTLANNHFFDFGEEGVSNTLEACRTYGIDYVGGGINLNEASKIFYKVSENNTIAIINCCEHEFSIATDISGGSNPLNPIEQYYSIKEACTNADHVIVIVHGGHEHHQLPSPRMQMIYRFFIDAGASIVVNHHQHCYSGYEIYNGKPIVYGTGNFCMDKAAPSIGQPWNYGYMVLWDTERPSDIRLIPYEQCGEKPVVHILPKDAFDKKLKELNSIINDKVKLEKQTAEYYASSVNTIRNVFEPIQNKLIAGLQHKHLLPSLISRKWLLKLQDFILCESHRDKIDYYLKNEKK